MLRLAFYKSNSGTWLDRAIGWWTRTSYSHVELIFSDGISFSSSPRDGGVRYKRIDFSSGKWDLIEIEVTETQEDRVRRWADEKVGLAYDWRGVFGFVFHDGYDRNRWFCSEICAECLALCGYLVNEVPHRISPGYLYTRTANGKYKIEKFADY